MGEPDEYLTFARAAFEHRNCRAKAQEFADGLPDGVCRDVTAVPPSNTGIPSWPCPHGVRYWLVPAGGER
jgi:hypothetical protein